MSLYSNIGWIISNLTRDEIQAKSILDVGSKNWDMVVTPFIKCHKPKQYIGVDKLNGEGVDIICDASDLVKQFGLEQFDIVLCIESIEHIDNWAGCIQNMKDVLKPGGIIILTTRTNKYAEHGYPDDYWRFQASDLEDIFSDFHIVNSWQDDWEHGAYIKAKKPLVLKKYQDISLFSIKHNRRIKYGE